MTKHDYNILKDKLKNYNDFDGKTITAIADELGVSVYTLNKALNELNIYIERIYGHGSNDRNSEIVSLYKSGESLDSIGKAYGISRQRVHQIIRECNPEYRDDFKKYSSQKGVDSIKFVGLRNYMIQNNLTKTDLYVKKPDVFPKYSAFCMRLRGTSSLDINSINAILEITGLSYEECFNVE